MNRLLNGEVEAEYVDAPNPRISELERELGDLRHRLQIAELEAKHAKEQVTVALTRLRSMTLPFYQLLRAVHGEIDALGIEEVPQPSSSAPGAPHNPRRASWEKWVQKLGGHRGAFLQTLLDHGPSNAKQILVGMGISRMQTVYDTAAALTKLNLIRKMNDNYALVE